MSASLSLCCTSGGPPGRTAAILRLLRPQLDDDQGDVVRGGLRTPLSHTVGPGETFTGRLAKRLERAASCVGIEREAGL